MNRHINTDVIKFQLQLLFEVAAEADRPPYTGECNSRPVEVFVEHATSDGALGYVLVRSSNDQRQQGFVSLEDAQEMVLHDVALIEKALYARAGHRPFIRRPYHGDIEKFGFPVDAFLVEALAPGTFRRTPIIAFSWPADDVFFTTDASSIQRARTTNAEILSGCIRVVMPVPERATSVRPKGDGNP